MLKEINNPKEENKNTENIKNKKKGELWLSYSRVSSIQQVTD
jgi:hypothetical protein